MKTAMTRQEKAREQLTKGRAGNEPTDPVVTGQEGLWLSGHSHCALKSPLVRVPHWGMDLSQVLEEACCV